MKKLTMPDITTRIQYGKKTRELKIPGGWTARIPEVTALDDKTMTLYGRFFTSQGLTPLQAQDEVVSAMNTLFESSWVRMIGTSVRYWARKYARRFPRNLRDDGTLKGFDPEVLQNTYVPTVNKGRAGKVYVNKLFKEMNESG